LWGLQRDRSVEKAKMVRNGPFEAGVIAMPGNKEEKEGAQRRGEETEAKTRGLTWESRNRTRGSQITVPIQCSTPLRIQEIEPIVGVKGKSHREETQGKKLAME